MDPSSIPCAIYNYNQNNSLTFKKQLFFNLYLQLIDFSNIFHFDISNGNSLKKSNLLSLSVPAVRLEFVADTNFVLKS